MTKTKKTAMAFIGISIALCLSAAMLLFCFTGCSDKKPISLEVNVSEVKTDYKEGEKLDLSGLVVTAVYGVGEKAKRKEITEYDTVPSNGSVLKLTDRSVTITAFEDISTKINLNVHNRAVGIEQKKAPDKTSYMVGEYFDPSGMVLTKRYENGKSEDISVSKENCEYKTDALSASDTVICVSHGGFSVDVPISMEKGVFIEAEHGIIKAKEHQIKDDANGFSGADAVYNATGGYYVGNLSAGDSIAFVFHSDSAGRGDVILRLASQYLKEDNNWTPIVMGNCKLNEICKFNINGIDYFIPSDKVLSGGTALNANGEKDPEGDAKLWLNWKEISMEDLSLIEGRNTITLTFVSHNYKDTSQPSFAGSFAANIDSLKVVPESSAVSPVKLSFDEDSSLAVESVRLEKDDNDVPYMVMDGVVYYNGYTSEEALEILKSKIEFDFQGNLSDGDHTRRLSSSSDRVVTLSSGKRGEDEYAYKGEFSVKIDVGSLPHGSKKTAKYATHFSGRGAKDENFNFITASETSSGKYDTSKVSSEILWIGDSKYSLIYEPQYDAEKGSSQVDKTDAIEHFFGTVGLMIEDKYVALGERPTRADIRQDENGRVYLVYIGTYTQAYSDESEIKEFIASRYSDLQSNGNRGGDWSSTRVTTTAEHIALGTDRGANVFTAEFDVTDIAVGAYTSHFSAVSSDPVNNADYKPMSSENSGKKIVSGGKQYELDIVLDDTGGYHFWGCPGIIITEAAE